MFVTDVSFDFFVLSRECCRVEDSPPVETRGSGFTHKVDILRDLAVIVIGLVRNFFGSTAPTLTDGQSKSVSWARAGAGDHQFFGVFQAKRRLRLSPCSNDCSKASC